VAAALDHYVLVPDESRSSLPVARGAAGDELPCVLGCRTHAPRRARRCLLTRAYITYLLRRPGATSSLEGRGLTASSSLFQRSASPSEAGSLTTSHPSLMPQQGHGRCKADADTVCDGRAQSASGGGDEGAVPPQIPLPPAPGLLSCSRRQAHTPGRGRACGCPSQEGATVRRERERPSVPFHPARPASS
jgi:hypothetical protein